MCQLQRHVSGRWQLPPGDDHANASRSTQPSHDELLWTSILQAPTDAPASNIIPVNKTLVSHLPNGDKLQSTHTSYLNLLDLSDNAQAAHIIPGLVSHSLPLLSIVTMCNTGCKVTFTNTTCTIITVVAQSSVATSAPTPACG
jgi:hypothetical protein